MKAFKVLWRKLTPTEALEKSSGELETLFFESVYRIFYITGLSNSEHGLFYKLYSNIVKFCLIMLFISETSYMIMDSTDLEDFSVSLNVVVLQMISYYKHKNMQSHSMLYRNLTTAMESNNFDISTDKRKKIVKYWSKTNQNYWNLVIGLGNMTLFAWFSYPLVDDVDYNLIVGLRLPFNYHNRRGYIIAYPLVLVVFYYVSHYVMTIDVRLQAHFLHLICQFNVLADCFENIADDCKNEGIAATGPYLYLDESFQEIYKKRLRGLVEQHRSLLRLVMELRSTLSGPMLGQLVASGVLICFLGYQATSTITGNITKGLMSFFFLGYNLFGFYIICRWCEEITTQSKSISTAAYSCEWENGMGMIPTVRSTLMLVIARANKPLIMTAGGMYDLSLMSYTSLVKTSYTALTVLLRFGD